MSKLNKLIQELCPNGVEYRKLGEVCEFQRGQTITAKDAVSGEIPVLAGGQKPAYYHNIANRTGRTIVVAGSGAYAGYVSYWETPIFVSDAFSVNPFDVLHEKFLFYFLKNIQSKIYATKKGSGVPHVHGSSIAKFEIPLPPLPIQEEIVKILDRFAEYTAELQAELQARKEQYEYYRNLLLTNNFAYGSADDKQKITGNAREEWKWMTLGEVCEKTKNIKWKEISPMQEYQYIDLSSVDRETSSITETQKITKDNAPSRAQQIVCKDDVIFGTTRPTLKRICFIPDIYDNQICSTGFCVLRAKLTIINPRFLYFSLTTSSFGSYVENNQEGAGYPSISNSKVMGYRIPIPSLAEQQRIVSILDKFEALVSDLTQGLPAEIAASQERYEYYRDKLLRFERCN